MRAEKKKKAKRNSFLQGTSTSVDVVYTTAGLPEGGVREGVWILEERVHEYIAAVSQYTKRINLHRRPLTRSQYNSLSLFRRVCAFVCVCVCVRARARTPLSLVPSTTR